MIDIADAYVTPAPGARATLSFERVRGLVTLRGGQLLGGLSPDTPGVLASDSEGIDIAGLKILDHRQPVRMSRCRDRSLTFARASACS